jgi:hypothetical protein
MRILWCIPVLMVLASPGRPATSWRWYLALSEHDRWSLSEGPASVVITDDSITAEFRDASDNSRIHLRLGGTVRDDSARVTVTLLGADAEPFPAAGKFQRLCSLGHGRELIMLVAEGGALGITRDAPCDDTATRR